MELITKTKQPNDLQWFNDLTDEMDKHLLPCWEESLKKGYTFGTYIYEPTRRENGMAIRFPGATRGHIEIDKNMVITNIVLYDTAFEHGIACYKKSVEEAVKKFIGAKIILSE
jgi:hypothetical protein